jgi:inner membrane protein
MPTILTHAVVGLALTRLARPERRPKLIGAVSAGLAMVPDADVVAFAFGVPHGSMWAHRGITHSLVAAAAVAAAVAAVAYRRARVRSRLLVPLFFLAMASHGVLDALTNGGPGVAFLAPFDTTRYFFPWRPVEVSPVGRSFFGARGLRVLESELRWIWLPTIVVTCAASMLQRLHSRRDR